jgi:hypothetical protein
MDSTFDLLTAANNANYAMGAGTSGGLDTSINDCGIAFGHAYSILETFLMNFEGTDIKMVLMRNPWGVTFYSSDWNHSDARWTDAMKA